MHMHVTVTQYYTRGQGLMQGIAYNHMRGYLNRLINFFKQHLQEVYLN